MAIKTVEEFSNEFQSLLGDSSEDITTPFIIDGINWCLRELPMVPRLEMLFSAHGQANLDAKGHYRWNIKDIFDDLEGRPAFAGFRMILDTELMTFWTSTGGEPCPLAVCNVPVRDFYEKHGIINLKQRGTPCEYTIEREGDEAYLVFDRPLDIPVMIDCIAGGILNDVHNLSDKFEISAVAENLMLDVLRTIWYESASDFAFAGAIQDYLDNNKVNEAINIINRKWSTERPVVLGG